MKEWTYDPEKYHKGKKDAGYPGIGRTDVDLCELVISFGKGFREFVAKTVSYADVKEGEPADDLGDGLPDTVAGAVQVVDGHRDKCKLTADTQPFNEKGVDDILVCLGRPGVIAQELVFYFSQGKHTDQSLK